MNIKILLRAFAILVLSACAVVAQSAEPAASPTPRVFDTSGIKTTAPVSWQQYSSSKDNFSVAFLKLPVVIRNSNWCSTIEKAEYYAYAEGVVYEVQVTSKSKIEPPKQCRSVDEFRPGLLDTRVEQLMTIVGVPTPTEPMLGRKTQMFRSNHETRWVFDDLEHDRWVEIAIHHLPGMPVDPERFVGSLSLSGGSGTEIGEGSAVTLGDEGSRNRPPIFPKRPNDASPTDEAAKPGSEKNAAAADSISGLVIRAKPRPSYTDEARRSHIQGTTRLRVTFDANGSIGMITAVSELPYGLTEQAVKAARRIVFIPKTVNGIPVTVTKLVEYSFSIY